MQGCQQHSESLTPMVVERRVLSVRNVQAPYHQMYPVRNFIYELYSSYIKAYPYFTLKLPSTPHLIFIHTYSVPLLTPAHWPLCCSWPISQRTGSVILSSPIVFWIVMLPSGHGMSLVSFICISLIKGYYWCSHPCFGVEQQSVCIDSLVLCPLYWEPVKSFLYCVFAFNSWQSCSWPTCWLVFVWSFSVAHSYVASHMAQCLFQFQVHVRIPGMPGDNFWGVHEFCLALSYWLMMTI